MAKFTIVHEFEVPDEIAANWEPTNEFRQPGIGDHYLTSGRDGITVGEGWYNADRHIVRRRFVWPAWLLCRYVVWHADGGAWGANSRDMVDQIMMNHFPGECIDLSCVDVGPCPTADWRESLRENPNWKGDA